MGSEPKASAPLTNFQIHAQKRHYFSKAIKEPAGFVFWIFLLQAGE